MKIIKIIISVLFISLFSLTFSSAEDCSKYDKLSKEPVIKKLERVSKPGLRKYTNSSSIPRVLNGLGINIISTSKGLMTGKKASRENLGGEIICNVY